MVRTSVAHSAIASCTTFLFLPHFDVICDLLLNWCTTTWNLFVKQRHGFQPINARILLLQFSDSYKLSLFSFLSTEIECFPLAEQMSSFFFNWRLYLSVFLQMLKAVFEINFVVHMITFLLLSFFIHRNRLFSLHRTNIFLKFKQRGGYCSALTALSPWRRGSISTRMEPVGYIWGLCHPRASVMGCHKIERHGSWFTSTYYDVKLSKPKIKAIKLKYMYVRFGKY